MKAGWEEVALGEVTQSINGLWKGKKPPFRKARVLRNTNFRSHGKLSLDDVAEIEVQVSQFAKRKLQKGDIILERSGGGPKQPVGRVAYFNEDGDDFSFSNFTSVIRVSDQRLDPRYLLQVLNGWHYLGETEKLQKRSTGIRNLRFAEYKAKIIPLPPLEEQKRIVAVLDAAFAKLDRARANVEANLADAEDLSVQLLAETFSKTVAYVELSKETDIISGQHILAADYNTDGRGIGYLTGPSDFGARHPVVSKWTQSPKRTALPGDVLVTVKGSGVGSANILTGGETAISRQLMALRPKRLPHDILFALLKSNYGRLQSMATGAAIPGLSRGQIGSIEIPIIEATEYEGLANKISAFEDAIASFQSKFNHQLADLDALRQSLLQRAFAGELT